MTIARFRGRCMHCGHDHDAAQVMFEAAIASRPEVEPCEDVEALIRNLHYDLTEPNREMVEIDKKGLRDVLTLLLKSHKALKSQSPMNSG